MISAPPLCEQPGKAVGQAVVKLTMLSSQVSLTDEDGNVLPTHFKTISLRVSR